MDSMTVKQMRSEAASLANREDADLWRWFCLMYEDRRLRWCESGYGWLISVDHKHLATEVDFDAAIRNARHRFESGQRRKPKVKHAPVNVSSVVVSIGMGRIKPNVA